MQQRQPRLGDVLDDYCPRERRVTNHVVVAMIGDNVKQTRCTTCDADHEYKQAKIPRVRRKTETTAALAAQGFAAPKLHDLPGKPLLPEQQSQPSALVTAADEERQPGAPDDEARAQDNEGEGSEEDAAPQTADEGPVHRRLIRASLPRVEGQAPPTRPNPEFTIRQPNNNRQNRFRPRQGQGQGQGRGPMQTNGNRSFGGGGYPQRQQGGGNQRRRNRPK